MGLDFAKIKAANAAKAAQNDSAQTTPSAPDTSTPEPAGSASGGETRASAGRLGSFLVKAQKSTSPISNGQMESNDAITSADLGPIAVDDSAIQNTDSVAEVSAADAGLESQEAKLVQVPALMRLNAAAPADSGVQEEKLDIIPPGPEGFKERLARLDRLIQADNGVTEINIGVARTYVKEVAIELKEFPEYMGIMKPLDIHNVMVFMRGTMAMAEKGFEKKDAASEKRATKKAAGAKFDFSGFDPAATPALPGSANAAAQGGLDAFANFDASKIPTLSRKG